SLAEVEGQLGALRIKLAELKATQDAAAQATQAPPPRTAGTPLPITLPKLKFDIRVPTNAELAANLKGHLLLVHGEIDNNVRPANTMRVVCPAVQAKHAVD